MEKIRLKTPFEKFGGIALKITYFDPEDDKVYVHSFKEKQPIYMTVDGKYIVIRADIDENGDLTA